MKHSIKEIKEKNQTTVTVTQRGGRGGGEGGGLTEVLYKEALPQGPTLTLCMYHFRQKRYPCSDKLYPFHIPNFERCIPF